MVKQSERVREIVRLRHVEQAKRAGLQRFAVSARDVLREAEASENFPRARTPLICNVLQSKKLLDENALEIERIDGPPSRQSRTVVVHYRLRGASGSERVAGSEIGKESAESADDWAARMIAPIRGLMKEKIAAHGGAEGFIQWVRSQDDEHAA